MSDQLTNTEKVIRDLLRKEQPLVDTTDIWSKLEGSLPPEPTEKRRRLLPFWWIVGLAGLTVVSMLIGYTVTTMPQPGTTVQPLTETTTAPATEAGPPAPSNASPVTMASPETEVSLLHREVLLAEAARNSTNTEQPAADRSSAEQVTMGDQLAPSSSSAKTATASQARPSLQKSTNIPTASGAAPVEHQTATVTPSAKQAMALQKEEEETTLVTAVALLPSRPVAVRAEVEVPSPSEAITNPVELAASRPMFVRVSSGIFHNSYATSLSAGSEFDAAYFARERGRLGTDFGIDVGRYIAGWKVFAGLGYNTSVAQYRHSDVFTRTDTEPGTAYNLIDEEGNTSAVSGDVQTTTTTYHDVSWHRRHSVLEARLGLGKTVWSSGPWSLGVEGLAGMAVHSLHTGYEFLEGEAPFVKVTDDTFRNYRKNMGWSAALRMPVAFQLRNTALTIAPTYRYTGNSITTPENFYQTKNSQIGIQFSITYVPRWEQF